MFVFFTISPPNYYILGHRCQLANIDLAGSDLAGIKNVGSWAECSEHCSNNADCQSFTWVGPDFTPNPEQRQDCYLKNGVPSQSTLMGVASGTSDCLTPTPPMEAHLFQDSKGDIF